MALTGVRASEQTQAGGPYPIPVLFLVCVEPRWRREGAIRSVQVRTRTGMAAVERNGDSSPYGAAARCCGDVALLE